MKTVDEMWAELEKVCRIYGPDNVVEWWRVGNGGYCAGAGRTRDIAIRSAYATLHPESAEAEALHRAVDELDPQATPQPVEDRSKCPDGYKTCPIGDGTWRADTIGGLPDGFICSDGSVAWGGTNTPHLSESAAIRACWAHKDRAEGKAPQPDTVPVDDADHDADLALRMLSLVRDGYWITPMGDGRYDWSLSENEQHICPDLESAIAAAETHRREQQQPKPVWYCRVPGRGEPRVPHNSESDAATEAARLAKIERRPVQVLGVVQVVRPDQA